VGALIRRTASVVWHEDRLEPHPHNAEQCGAKDGDWVRIASRAGEQAQIEARKPAILRSIGVVFASVA
jgi:predicted molibdopterin-dependent oxidoreductase YjgC